MSFSQAVPAPTPQPPQRPALANSIAIATELWLVIIAALSIAQFGGYPQVRDALQTRLAELPKDASASTREATELMTNPALIVVMLAVTVLVGAAIALTAMYFARQGYTWARLLLSALSAYVLVGAVMAFFAPAAWTQAPQIVAGVCAVAALLLLMRRDADTYCREMAAFRTAAKTPAPVAWPGSWPPQPGAYPPPHSPESPGGSRE